MSQSPILGILNRIELRNVWTNEALHFTPWLAEEENLRLLSETIGLGELEFVSKEKAVGPFSADILCKNTSDDSFVLIENQLERTDHKHLGQLLTYAAGLEAVTIVWIAEKITDEHRAALDWLNQITPEKYSFFGLEIELWKIGDSAPAPKFNIVSEPNGWSKLTKSAVTTGELTDTRKVQLEFWTVFREYVKANSKLNVGKPSPRHWLAFSIGRSHMQLSTVISSWDPDSGKYGTGEIRVELILTGEDAKRRFQELLQYKEEIQKPFETELFWKDDPRKIRCMIIVTRKCDFMQKPLWHEQHDWLLQNLLKFQNVLSPYLRNLD